tara:strand:+ start:194 stop:586 length:393 start_codon:yes stop_codon:yes gene_type:complete
MSTPTPTPRTDYECVQIYTEDVTGCANAVDYVPASFARGLEAELAAERAIVSRIWTQLGSVTYEQLKGRSIYDLIDELKADLAAERARLDWLAESWDNPLAIHLQPYYGWSAASKNLRAVIDAKMQEGAK